MSREPAEATPELYLAIQQFYARHMHLLDRHEVDDWADTFTTDAVFDTEALPEPVVGRTQIAEKARQFTTFLEHAGITRRHWLGMLAVEPRGEEVLATSYVLEVETLRGGPTLVRNSLCCEDRLVRHDGSWLVHHRHATRDDMAGPPRR